GTDVAPVPARVLATWNPPAAVSVAVFVRVTSAFSPSPIVTSDGENAGSPHATPSTWGSGTSANVAVVPTGKFCGPSTGGPAARAVSVPVTVVPSSTEEYSTVNAASSGTRSDASPTTDFATENPPAGESVAVFVTVTSAFSPSATVTSDGENDGA